MGQRCNQMLTLDLPKDTKIVVRKLDAARSQLRTAIRLWFEDADPVSIHTLAVAAYGILHTLARRSGATDLLFDSLIIRKEMRNTWARLLKDHASFFKHADHDPTGEIAFPLFGNEIFILYSILALSKMSGTLSMEERAFLG